MRSLKGFSLPEIILVIAIIAILSTIFAIYFYNFKQKTKDAQRKADINAIYKIYEVGFNSANGLYKPLTGSEFKAGHIPTPPEGGQYSGLLASPAESYQVCAALENHPTTSCNTPSETCFCRSSSQGKYVAAAGSGSESEPTVPPTSEATAVPSSSDTSAPAVTTIYVTAKTSNSVTLRWAASGDDGSNGQAAIYNLRRSDSNIPDFDWDTVNWPETIIATSPPGLPGTIETQTVSGLLPNKKYYFAIKTIDEEGNQSPISNNVYVTTDPSGGDVRSPYATALQFISMTATSITFNIAAPSEDDIVGFSQYDLSQAATAYDLRRGPSAINISNWNTQTQISGLPAPAFPGTMQSVTISGLTTNTYYCFVLRSSDEAGNQSGLSANVCKTIRAS